MATETKLIVNLTRGECVCVGEMADRPLRRMRGLMGRRGLPAGEGLLISPAPAIHTAFMRFPIDALFLDRNFRVLEIVERLRPWRFASKRRARAVLELSAGECARRGVRVGDRLELRDRKSLHAQLPTPDPAGGGASPQASPPSGPGARTLAGSSAREDDPAFGDGPALGGWVTRGDGPRLQRGELARLQPLRVLVVSPDRRFRTVMSLLLARRNCSVTTSANGSRVAELVDRESVDIVVIDASQLPSDATHIAVAMVEGLARPVGVVLVADEGGSEEAEPADDGSSAGVAGPPVLAKWGPFEDLFDAIESADERRGTWKDIRARG